MTNKHLPTFEESSCFDPVLKPIIVPEIGKIYEHVNGNIYAVVGLVNMESTNIDYVPGVLYIGENGHTWYKPIHNFVERMKKTDRTFKFKAGVVFKSINVGGFLFSI